MAAVRRWSGVEARALRISLRLSVRAFADYLGLAARTVSKWEAGGGGTFPRPDTQAILDMALARADGAAQERFEMLCRSAGAIHRTPPRRQSWEYEAWTDDLERASMALSRQDFSWAETLLDRWFLRFSPADLDDRGSYLYARSLALQGGVRRDRGSLIGPNSARASFAAARQGFIQLGIESRVAQADLSLVVLTEMRGGLEESASAYEALSHDNRLCERDRALSLLWVGTALSKVRRGDATTRALSVMESASAAFEELNEAIDWGIAQQKLALAYRAQGEIYRALSHIDMADRNRISDSPLQVVRLETARAHILLSDRRAHNEGSRMLNDAEEVAVRHGLRHQVESIRRIRYENAGR